MRRVAAALLAAALLLTGCDGVRPPGETKIDVNTPKLRELKAETGMVDCVPGEGAGELPDITLPCLGGGTSVDLSSLTGPAIINFWSSNCGPCRTEMPALEEFNQRHGEQVQVIGIDYADTYPEAALGLIEDTGVTYPSLADPGGELAEQMRIPGLPQFVFLDESGAIVEQKAGGIDSVAEVEALVKTHLGITL